MKRKWILLGLVGLLAIAGTRSAPAATVTWNGTTPYNVNDYDWDTTTLNWLDAGGQPTTYAEGDNVTFGDMNYDGYYGNSAEIHLQSWSCAPGTITVNSDVTTYKFAHYQGGPLFSASTATSLVKNGASELICRTTLACATTVNQGTVILYDGATFASLTLNGGTIASEWDGSSGDSNTSIGNAATVVSLGSNGGTFHVAQTNGYRIVPQGFQSIVEGTIVGSGKLTKTGSGRLILSGNNTYAGGTLINQGMLEAASSTALGTGNLELSGPSAYHGDYITWSAAKGSYYTGMVFMWDDMSYETTPYAIPEYANCHYACFNLNNQNVTVDQLTLTRGNIVDVIHQGDPTTGEPDPDSLQGYGYLPAYVDSHNRVIQYGTGTITASAFNVMDGSIYANLAGTAAALTKSTDGWVVLQAPTANTYGGGTFVQAGTLTANSAASLPDYGTSGKLSVSNGATMSVGGGTAGWTSGQIGTLLGNTSAWAVGSTFGMDTTNGSLSYSGNASGNFGLAKFGEGTAVLSGTNTYAGPTHVVAGTLTANSPNSLPGYNVSGNVTVDSGAVVTGSRNWTSAQIDDLWNHAGGASDGFVGIDTSAGSFTYTCGVTNPTVTGFAKTGGNKLKVMNALPGGALSVAAGTLDISSQNQTVGDLTGAGTISIGSRTFTVGGTGSTEFSGAITGTGNVVKTGSGSLWLTHTAPTSGPDTWHGSLTLAQGTLGFASGGIDNCSSIVFNGGALRWAGDYTYGWYWDDCGFPEDESMWELKYGVLNSGNTQDMSAKIAPIAAGQAAIIDTNGNNVSFATALSGEGGLTKTGDGSLTLTAVNSYLGPTTVNGGSLVANATGAVAGNATVNGGTLRYGVNNGLATTSNVTVNGGTFDLSSHVGTVQNVTLAGGQITSDVNGSLSVTGAFNVQSGTVRAVLTGATSLTKTGAGTVVVQMQDSYDILAGDVPVNTYTGVTTVDGGRLVLKANVIQSWYAGTPLESQVAYGAWNPVLNLGGADVKSGTLSFDYSCSGGTSPAATIAADLAASFNAAGGHFASGQIYSSTAVADGMALGWIDDTANSVVDVMYTYFGDLNLDGATDFTDLTTVLGHYNATSGMVWASGDFNYDGAVDFTDLTMLLGNYNKVLGSFATVAVPEPSTLVLSLLGLVGLAGFAWRKRK